MTDSDRRVATLAALFAPQRVAALLARLGSPGASGALALAVRLADASRSERLRALSSELIQDAASARGRVEAVASLERNRTARLLRRLAAARAPDDVSPVVERLCREHLAR